VVLKKPHRTRTRGKYTTSLANASCRVDAGSNADVVEDIETLSHTRGLVVEERRLVIPVSGRTAVKGTTRWRYGGDDADALRLPGVESAQVY